ncbi:hypothetical protein, conserved in P.knowlesi [Plasmodium knowlesi strain H]|uniref:Uncharacterized protein n=3 Tax=Plasmodium knowlesi TaxID=5850 RepID=A0A1A7VUU5_PLAKH|nr:hypothetical protein, conserved in P.knowlesi [Plasmodium knowlesi strain H]OTN66531.1 Uncharacterized protein PKNOH_S09517500 [Plasmodium knowlesi]CAA9991367.1 hypothetical protein, conserved in P.knowlesi [Plasmodium knowlesi strain H]SBO25596.1 hypothetical protein, conserved in P.knowlesi [Plasmodium knowlesi strain H]SBO28331.1 hypothetical protein, conserved in P.knowlesi [Plasmodium knowlesi strain H]VVS80841.1 hypothetical protein, conserved in P.knowlesi [Plasmodium knowlesi strain
MAPFSFIKTSTLIFAYLFLLYQTNYHHQVSALSTLNHYDDVSDGSGLYSSEEDINNGSDRLKTVQGNGTNVPTTSHRENELDDNDVSTLLGSIDNELLEHTLSGRTPSSAKRRENSSKGLGTKIKECCKKLKYSKNRKKMFLILILVSSVFHSLALCYTFPAAYLLNFVGFSHNSIPMTFYIWCIAFPAIIGLIYFGILFWFYRSKVWVKCIMDDSEIRKCLREEFEKVQHQQQTT